MASFYLVIVPQGVTPTWSRSNVATNSGWTATTIAYHDADTDPGSGTTYQFVPDASGLTAGTPYEADVTFLMPRADATIVLATPSGRIALNALPVSG